jgi:SAM-dependent methyltransferase
MAHIFDRSGVAALSDFRASAWQEYFKVLETEQSEFLARENQFRSLEYKWARDPLHTWSRAWEYPFVYHHLLMARRAQRAGAPVRVADVGSGVTFFPFAVAKLGYDVICTDVDPICAVDIPRAYGALPASEGKVEFRLSDGSCLPFDSRELDAVYCISVLEHIPDFGQTVAEIARVLRPGGLLVLTIDLDLRGDGEIGVDKHRMLIRQLQNYFSYHHAERVAHPADVLTTFNGPFAPPKPTFLYRSWFSLKQWVKPFMGRKSVPLFPFELAVQGFALSCRDSA